LLQNLTSVLFRNAPKRIITHPPEAARFVQRRITL